MRPGGFYRIPLAIVIRAARMVGAIGIARDDRGTAPVATAGGAAR
jgi:hypothetical protein